MHMTSVMFLPCLSFLLPTAGGWGGGALGVCTIWLMSQGMSIFWLRTTLLPGHEHFLPYQREVYNRYLNCLLVYLYYFLTELINDFQLWNNSIFQYRSIAKFWPKCVKKKFYPELWYLEWSFDYYAKQASTIYIFQAIDWLDADTDTGRVRLIRSLSSARFSFELSGFSDYEIISNSNLCHNFELEIISD